MEAQLFLPVEGIDRRQYSDLYVEYKRAVKSFDDYLSDVTIDHPEYWDDLRIEACLCFGLPVDGLDESDCNRHNLEKYIVRYENAVETMKMEMPSWWFWNEELDHEEQETFLCDLLGFVQINDFTPKGRKG